MKRLLLIFTAGIFFINTLAQPGENTTTYFPEIESLKKHKSPQWFNDAKLGIFIHWGLYSVPAYASQRTETSMDTPEKWMKNNSLAEWYLNTVRIEDSPTQKYHNKKYGENFNYFSFSDEFNREIKKWNPQEMAAFIKSVGAKYVVFTTKHHDGYPLWPTRVANTNMPPCAKTVERDLVGELSDEVRKAGIKMGLYYSGGFDWTYNLAPMTTRKKLIPQMTPKSNQYGVMADAHLRELIRDYKPDILWNDIYYPKSGDLVSIISDYYNLVPGGVINNRWGISGLYDFTTPEYRKYDKIVHEKWESCRGLGHSWGFNQIEDASHTLSSTELIHLLVDVVSKNGNLIINIGPQADGSIPEIQKDRLTNLGKWMKLNSEAIYGTTPWHMFNGQTTSGIDMRFTQKDDQLYLFLFSEPGKEIEIGNMLAKAGTVIEIPGKTGKLKWENTANGLKISMPGNFPCEHAFVLRFSKTPSLITW